MKVPLGFPEKKATNYADMILFNGKIYTVDKDFSMAGAVAIKNGRFLAVGDMDDVAPYEGPETEKIDLKGLPVIPGLMDSHIHFSQLGGMLTGDRSKIRNTTKAWLDSVAEEVARAKPGEWIQMPFPWGFDRELTAKVIDTVSPDNPVHFFTAPNRGLVNSKAMEVIGIRKGEKIERGSFDVDENGEPTGRLTGYANALGAKYGFPNMKAKIAGNARGPEAVETYKERIRAAMKAANKFGLTSVIQQGSNFNEYRAYRELAAAGESMVRAQAEIWMMFWDFIPL
ncbi:MAG: amidohydrolase family protein, partial [Deltaproteobacteria bacterium]|nr:amidohydrolase family protein [Deltaproteobacteria bacterium]